MNGQARGPIAGVDPSMMLDRLVEGAAKKEYRKNEEGKIEEWIMLRIVSKESLEERKTRLQQIRDLSADLILELKKVEAMIAPGYELRHAVDRTIEKLNEQIAVLEAVDTEE